MSGINNLAGQCGELRATVHITRKATGKVETYELVGHSDPEKLKELLATENAKRKHGTSGVIVCGGAAISTEQEPRE